MCSAAPGKIDATMPDVAVASAICPSDLTVMSRAQYKYVFPVPPGP